jgi:putative nucleotidyltransferase with HDIG domain
VQLASGQDRILFVVDAAGLSRCAGLISEHEAEHVLLEDLSPAGLGTHRLVAVDVDLTDLANAKALRISMRGRRYGFFQAFAVDLHRRLETINANIVGATDLTRRPFQARELLGRIAALEERQRSRPESVIVGESIGRAAAALGELFAALTAGTNVELPGLITASTEITDAIAELGFPGWVDEVRRHHEGTFQHCLIVTGLASAFGLSTGMGRRDTLTLTTAGLLHDIGKAAVPVTILDKPGKLTPEEFDIIRTHPVRGWHHLSGTAGIDADVLGAVRSPHEYLDGSGYPDGLGGADIGDLTRILTICNFYGAMIESRAYKPAAPPAAAMAVLEEMARAGKVEWPLVRAFQQSIAA